MASSTSGTSSNTVTFTGTSRYSLDFQNVINRALAIAGLPMTQLNKQVNTLNTQYQAMQGLDDKFSALADAVGAIGSAMGSTSFSADVSDPSVAQATVTDGAMEGVYSIEVTDLGAYTKTVSADSGPLKVTDPSSSSISAATNYTLTVGTTTYAVTPDSNTLYGLASAINAGTSGVRATVVDLGSSAGHDYRLSLQNTKLGDVGIQLSANTKDEHNNPVSTSLMTEQVRGSLAKYKVDGSSQEASSDSRTVTIAPGLSVTMLAESPEGEATDITLTRQSEPLSNALQTFVSAYNKALDAVNEQRGQSGGAISGQSVVYQLRDALNQLGTYFNGGGAIKSIADLGVTFDKSLSGHLEFDSSTLLLESFRNMGGITSFLGDSTSGFLKAATDAMNSVEDPTRGSLKVAMTANQNQILDDNDRISTEQAKIDQLQTQLMNQMAAADALISAMEQQYTVVSNLFQAMNSSSNSNSSNQNSLA